MRTNKFFNLLALLVLASLVLSACGGKSDAPKPVDVPAVQTAAVESHLTAQAAASPTPDCVANLVALGIAESVAKDVCNGASTGSAAATATLVPPTAAVSGTACAGVTNVSEGQKFDHVQNHDMGDPFNYWLIFAWNGSDTDTWFGTVGEPMLSLDVERDRVVGVEYIVKAESIEAVVCLAREIAQSLGIKPFWLYIAKNDLNLPGGFSADFPGNGWAMHVKPFEEAPIKDGNDWFVNGQQFSPSTSDRTFGNATAYTLIQSWNTSVGFDPAHHVLVAPGYEATFSKPYQGAIFQTKITVSLKRYFERVLQMVNEVIFRDSTTEITITVYTSYCGPTDGDRPMSWDDPLPSGVSCAKIP